eukprot:c23389_g1_i1 orf=36-278(-)
MYVDAKSLIVSSSILHPSSILWEVGFLCHSSPFYQSPFPSQCYKMTQEPPSLLTILKLLENTIQSHLATKSSCLCHSATP